MNRRGLMLFIWAALLLLGMVLLLWSLQSVPIAELARTLSALQPWQLVLLILVNVAIVLIFPWRWSRILAAQGYKVPYLSLARYRLLAFAISYFTPGQHFGGEPLQVLALRDKHAIPGSAALASVTLDKVIELFTNFGVLALGLSVLLATGMVAELPLAQALPISLVLLLVPALYLASVSLGKRPVSWLTQRLGGRFAEGLRNAERQLGELARRQPRLLWQGLLIAALVWAVQIFEFWLALLFLGLPLTFLELTLVVVAGRLALFAPTPGALGALEASQVLAMVSLGHDPAFGLSLSLLIRARDIFFALTGLALGALRKG